MSDQSGNEEIELEIGGMTCPSCATHVTKALQAVAGVADVHVPGWATGRATLVAQAGVGDADLVHAVEEAGYRAAVQSRHEVATRRPPQGRREGADYDLIVLGTGGAGVAAAIKAAELGRRVCVVEAGVIGGTCVNIGCVPSKTLIRAAAAFHTAAHQPFAGVHTRVEGLDWSAVISQKDDLVGELRQAKYIDVLASYGDLITLVHGHARVQADGSVAIENGPTLTAVAIVVATGARPRILPLSGIEDVDVLTSTSAMALDKQPRSLLIIGGRAIALEMGQTFARLGTAVTILQRSARILPEHEPAIADALTEYLRQEGLAVVTGVQPLAIRQEAGEKVVTAEIDGQRREFRAEQVLMAVGRTPNTQELNLEAAGVKLDAAGFIEVDEFMQSSQPGIYAAGDVTNRPKLVYVAAAGGSIAADNALNGNSRRLDLTALPDVIFTDPQVATVGLTEEQATEQGYAVQTSELPLSYVPRALAARDVRGLVKLVAESETGRLLGAHILAAEGGEVVQLGTLAVKFGLTVDDLTGTLFPYLTQSEALKLAAQTFNKDVSKLSCCAG
jgi:mercuric reductase